MSTQDQSPPSVASPYSSSSDGGSDVSQPDLLTEFELASERIAKRTPAELPVITKPQPRPPCARKGCGCPWSEHDFGTFCP